MPTKESSRRRKLLGYLAERKPDIIDEAEWRELRSVLAPISEPYLRRLLQSTGFPVKQPLAGVRQCSFEELEISLLELEQLYSEAVRAGDRMRARQIRRAVIESKDHARLAARNPRLSPQKKAEKQEMVEWMLVWLGNPGVFPAWAELRKKACAG